MENILLITNIIFGAILVILVLFQKSEGGALGIGVSQDNFMFSRSAGNFLTKATARVDGALMQTKDTPERSSTLFPIALGIITDAKYTHAGIDCICKSPLLLLCALLVFHFVSFLKQEVAAFSERCKKECIFRCNRFLHQYTTILLY